MKTHENRALFSRALLKATTCLFLTAGAGVSSVWATPETTESMRTEMVQQQTVTVSGVVKDRKGEPIIGANIMEKGTTNGTITDFDGKYTLKVKNAKSILVVSYIGYQTQEIPVGNGGKKDITLQDDSELMDEVVVIGYGTQRKGDVTSAVASVKAEDFTAGKIGDAAELIKGKVAGLTIAKGSGDPNAESTIRLRGVISLQGGSTPLVLVDGIEGGLGTVSPENIASIDVLKDASSTAIYGAKGANGVILVTTKNGQRESRTAANYSGYMSLSKFGKTLDFYGAEEIRQGLTNYADKGYDTDWLDAVSRTAFTHNHNFNISGGSKNPTYSADFTYRKEEGVLLETYNEEMRMRFDVSHWMLNDMLKVNFNMVKTFHKNGPIDAAGLGIYRQAIMRNPTEPIWNEDGTFYENFAVNYYYNPVGIIREQDGKYNSTRMTGNITFEPIKNWQTNLMLSRRVTSDHNRGYYTSEYFSQKSENHTGYAYHSQNEYTTDNLEVTSKYNHTWNKHRFDALVGYNYQYNVNEGFGANNYDYPTDFYLWNNLGLGTALKDGKAGMSSYKNDNTLIGFFGRVSYGYDNKYNVLLSVRREGSSKFGENNKWATFPSVALGWRIDQEEFLKEISWISQLKLRLGYGVTGNSAITPYQTKGGISSLYYPFGPNPTQGYIAYENEAGITNTLANQNLGWEKTAQWNIGVDFNFFNGRINGIVDVYTSKTTDLLMAQSIPTLTGYARTYANVGKTKNFGYDLTFNFVPVRTKDFEWNIGVNAAYSRNEIVSLANGKEDDPANGWFIGESTNSIYTYESAGLWKEEDRADMEKFNANGHDFQIGMARPVDQNGDYKIDANNDRTIVGHYDPRWTLGLNTNFTYKGWDLGIQLYGRMGFKYYDSSVWVGGRYNVRDYDYYNENNKNAAHPKPIYDEGGKDAYYNETYLKNGSYLKIRNISLGYTFPNRLLTHTGLSALRMYAQIKNPGYIFSGCKTLDLDTYSNTYNSGFTFGLNLSF